MDLDVPVFLMQTTELKTKTILFYKNLDSIS